MQAVTYCNVNFAACDITVSRYQQLTAESSDSCVEDVEACRRLINGLHGALHTSQETNVMRVSWVDNCRILVDAKLQTLGHPKIGVWFKGVVKTWIEQPPMGASLGHSNVECNSVIHHHTLYPGELPLTWSWWEKSESCVECVIEHRQRALARTFSTDWLSKV